MFYHAKFGTHGCKNDWVIPILLIYGLVWFAKSGAHDRNFFFVLFGLVWTCFVWYGMCVFFRCTDTQNLDPIAGNNLVIYGLGWFGMV